MCTTTNGLEFYNACRCAGTGCGGHANLNLATMSVTPVGYQGAARHTYTPACAGFHEAGPCPPSQQPVPVQFR